MEILVDLIAIAIVYKVKVSRYKNQLFFSIPFSSARSEWNFFWTCILFFRFGIMLRWTWFFFFLYLTSLFIFRFNIGDLGLQRLLIWIFFFLSTSETLDLYFFLLYIYSRLGNLFSYRFSLLFLGSTPDLVFFSFILGSTTTVVFFSFIFRFDDDEVL